MSGGKKKIRDFSCLRTVTENEFKKNKWTIYQSFIVKKEKKILVLFPKKVIFMDQINIQENFPTI